MLSLAFDRDCPSSSQALVEQRPSGMAGLLIGTIAALLLALVFWLGWTQVEEVVRAPGRVEPAGKVKIVNHPRGGRVAAIHVHDGDRVAAGAELVTFDGQLASSEAAELTGRWQGRMIDAARLEAEASGEPLQLPGELAQARPDLAQAAARLLKADREALAGRRDTLAKAVQARRNDVRTAAAETGRSRNSLTLLRQQLEAVKELSARGLYPALKLNAVERQVSDTKGEAEKADAALAASQSALAESVSQLAGVEKEARADALDELSRVVAERDRLGEQVRAQGTIVGDLVLRAPVAGIVQDLAIAGPGQAVGAHETLMKIVPAEEGLVVEARVRNEDIGRLQPGMPATLKVRAFDYLRYGSLEGRVQKVAADATPDPRTGELGYTVTVAAGDAAPGRSGGRFEIAPGMVVDVELKVGNRTILSYLTDRVLRFQDTFRDG